MGGACSPLVLSLSRDALHLLPYSWFDRLTMSGPLLIRCNHSRYPAASNLYPTPHTVLMKRGRVGSASIFSRTLRMWTVTVLASPA